MIEAFDIVVRKKHVKSVAPILNLDDLIESILLSDAVVIHTSKILIKHFERLFSFHDNIGVLIFN